MRVCRALVAAGLFLLLSSGPVLAPDTVTVRLATLAWDGSPWHKLLKEMGDEWQRDTQGRVRLRIYPGGVVGDDPDLVRKIRIGHLQAGTLTISGLSEIDDAFNVFTVPMFFDSYEEFTYVQDQLTPVLKRRLEAKGFVLLHWGYGGWVHIFSKRRVENVDDLRRVKMFTWAGDDRMVQVWRSNGFRPVALASTDILMGLQTGLIEGIPTPPLAALISQWYRHTRYMLEPGVSPLVGATVISLEAWNRIPARDRPAMLRAASKAGNGLAVQIPEKDRGAVTQMQARGLEVIRLDRGGNADTWMKTAEAFARKMRAMVPPEVFEMAVRHRADYREGRSGGSAR